jgi:transcription initiation factor TFIIB
MMNEMIMQEDYPPLQDNTHLTECPSCQSTTLVEDRETGEVICANCGLVIRESTVSLKQDWRSFTLQEHNDRSRNGYALSNKIYDKGLSTTFLNGHDSNGKKLNPETRELMNRLKKQDMRSKVNESWQRNLKIALSEMSRICNEMHLPDHIHESAAQIYRKTLKEDLVRGRSIDGFVSASIYAACRIGKIPRSISEIAEAANLTEHEVRYYYRLLVKEMDFKPPIDQPKKFISSLSSKLSLHGPVEETSMQILTRAKEQKLVMGKNPRGVAAAILYLACKESGIKISQTQVASVANISEVTMRKRFKDYEPIIAELGVN